MITHFSKGMIEITSLRKQEPSPGKWLDFGIKLNLDPSDTQTSVEVSGLVAICFKPGEDQGPIGIANGTNSMRDCLEDILVEITRVGERVDARVLENAINEELFAHFLSEAKV